MSSFFPQLLLGCGFSTKGLWWPYALCPFLHRAAGATTESGTGLGRTAAGSTAHNVCSSNASEDPAAKAVPHPAEPVSVRSASHVGAGWKSSRLWKGVRLSRTGFDQCSAPIPAGSRHMHTSIQWETDWDLALAMTRVQGKHVLIDFFNPG